MSDTTVRRISLRPEGKIPNYMLRSYSSSSHQLITPLLVLQRSFNSQLVGLKGDEKGNIVSALATCVVRELSELLDAVIETRTWRPMSPEVVPSLRELRWQQATEFVDVLLFLTNIAVTLGLSEIELSEAFTAKLKVLAERFPEAVEQSEDWRGE